MNEEAKIGFKTKLEKIKNATELIPKGGDVFKAIKQETSEVVRLALNDWQYAYEDAKDVDNPDRTYLLELYEQIELDTHVTAVTETIYHGVSSMDFQIKENGKEISDEKTELFKNEWFDVFVSLAVESIFWGFSGIQYYNVIDNKFKNIKSIPRYNIIPEKNGFVINNGDNKIHKSFDDNPYKQWTTLLFPRMFGDQYSLGKYNKIAKWFILKREVVQFWAIYNELFGMPFRTIKTKIKDNARRQNAINAMETMTAAAYAVIDTEDEVTFALPSGSSGQGTFQDFIDLADKQISKGLIGSTMVLDEGSSRSQGEVHEKNTNSFVLGYSKKVANWINDELIPKMSELGFPISKTDKFSFDKIEKLTKKEWTEIITNLSNTYDVPVGFVVKTTGIPVEEKEVQLPTGLNPEGAEEGKKELKNISEGIKGFWNKIIK